MGAGRKWRTPYNTDRKAHSAEKFIHDEIIVQE
jgi:hypothetical protein